MKKSICFARKCWRYRSLIQQRYISTKLNERKLKFQESLAKLQVFKATLKELEKRAMEKDMHPLSESALSIHTMLHQAQDKVLEISARTSQVDWARVAMIGATNSKALVFDAEADIAMHMKMKLAHDENTAHSNVSAWHISKNISQARKIGSVADLKDVVAKLE